MKGLRVEIFRSSSCATNGVTASSIRSLTMIGEHVAQVFEPTADAPAMYLIYGPVGQPILCPEPNRSGYMFGGNYASTSDSRFGEVIRQMVPGVLHTGPIMIFDRNEYKMATEPMLSYHKGFLSFSSGAAQWRELVVFSTEGRADPDLAMKMLAEAESSESIQVTPFAAPTPISRRDFDVLSKHGVTQYCFSEQQIEAWQACASA